MRTAALRVLSDVKTLYRRGASTSAMWSPLVRHADEVLASAVIMKANAAWAAAAAARARVAYAHTAGRAAELRRAVRVDEMRRIAEVNDNGALDAAAAVLVAVVNNDDAPADGGSSGSSGEASAQNARRMALLRHTRLAESELRRVRDRWRSALARVYAGAPPSTLWSRVADDERRAAVLWQRVLRDLTSERAPWAAPVTSGTRAHWKLDKTENYARMRVRLQRAFNARSYAGCAQDSAIAATSSSADAHADNDDDASRALLSGIALATVAMHNVREMKMPRPICRRSPRVRARRSMPTTSQRRSPTSRAAIRGARCRARARRRARA
jgi:hypothetical protein